MEIYIQCQMNDSYYKSKMKKRWQQETDKMTGKRSLRDPTLIGSWSNLA